MSERAKTIQDFIKKQPTPDDDKQDPKQQDVKPQDTKPQDGKPQEQKPGSSDTNEGSKDAIPDEEGRVPDGRKWIRMKQRMKEMFNKKQKKTNFEQNFVRKHTSILATKTMLQSFVQCLLELFQPDRTLRKNWDNLKPVADIVNPRMTIITPIDEFMDSKEHCNEHQATYLSEMNFAYFEVGDLMKELMQKISDQVLVPISDFVDDDFQDYMDNYNALEDRRLEKDSIMSKILKTTSMEAMDKYEREIHQVTEGFNSQANKTIDYITYIEESAPKYKTALIRCMKIERDYHKQVAARLEQLFLTIIPPNKQLKPPPKK